MPKIRNSAQHGLGFKRKSATMSAIKSLSKKQRKHLKEFGEIHPLDMAAPVMKHHVVSDRPATTKTGQQIKERPSTEIANQQIHKGSSESEEEEEDKESAYLQLVSMIQQDKHNSEDDASFEGGDSDDSDDEDDGIDDDGDTDDEDNDIDDDGDTDDDDDGDIDDEDDDSGDSIEYDTKENKDEGINLKQKKKEKRRKIADGDVSDENEVIDDVDDLSNYNVRSVDPFCRHFEVEIDEELAERLKTGGHWKKKDVAFPRMGNGVLACLGDPCHSYPSEAERQDLVKQHVKQKLVAQTAIVNTKFCAVTLHQPEILTKLQQDLFTSINTYQDVYYPDRNYKNSEEIRLVYCLHALNHVLKTRSRVIAHNTKIKVKTDEAEEYRDQGLTRPKVLIILPFREAAVRVVNLMIHLLGSENQSLVSNKKRFQSEFSQEDDDEKGVNRKPEDFEAMFAGNIDDHFRVGLGVAKKTLKLFTNFYSSDIILASPLGLRTIIGAEGEAQDYDFLSSVEVVIFDQTDVYLMQNWDHILHLLQHMHLQPKQSHGVDFSRVRMWTLNGWSKYYRQTILFSSVSCPEINSVFNKHCHNHAGKLSIHRPVSQGSICQIVLQLPQVFHRIQCSSFSQVPDARFEFFIKKILPHHKDPVMSQTLVFIPSYFDYVRLRNYLTKEEVDFVHICEYSKDKVIARARGLFTHKKVHFMLYTERMHFYHRYKLRGIRHLVFYELPLYPHFYSELSNFMMDPRRRQRHVEHENFTCTAVYSKYDAQKLSEIVGSQRASQMLSSTKLVHMFVSGDT